MSIPSSIASPSEKIEISPNKPRTSQLSNSMMQKVKNPSVVVTQSNDIKQESSANQQTQQSDGQTDVKIPQELQLNPVDFEKKFQKVGDCLQRSEFQESWKYESNGENYIVKKFIKLDESKWKKLVSSYCLQYSLSQESDLFFQPYKLVTFSQFVTPTPLSRVSNTTLTKHTHNHLHASHPIPNTTQNLQQSKRWQLYVIYQKKNDCISLEQLIKEEKIIIKDTDIVNIIVQIFKIGQECSCRNFPLINWKFSNIFICLYQIAPGEKANDHKSIKIVSDSLKVMDLYDYFGIENRDPSDPLLPPELRYESKIFPIQVIQQFGKQSQSLHLSSQQVLQQQQQQLQLQQAQKQTGTLEQSSIYMTGIIITLLLKYKMSKHKSSNQQNPTLKELFENNKKPKNESFRSNIALSTAIFAAASKEGEAAAAASQTFIEELIQNLLYKNPLLHALAMILKVIISSNQSERPTFSASLDVLRNIFGEGIDCNPRIPSLFSKGEKKIMVLLELSNSLVEQQDLESASIILAKAKHKLSKLLNIQIVSPTIKAFDLLSTGNMFMFQGRSYLAIRQYFDALREIQQSENTPEEKEEEIFYHLCKGFEDKIHFNEYF